MFNQFFAPRTFLLHTFASPLNANVYFENMRFSKASPPVNSLKMCQYVLSKIEKLADSLSTPYTIEYSQQGDEGGSKEDVYLSIQQDSVRSQVGLMIANHDED